MYLCIVCIVCVSASVCLRLCLRVCLSLSLCVCVLRVRACARARTDVHLFFWCRHPPTLPIGTRCCDATYNNSRHVDGRPCVPSGNAMR